MKPTILIFFSFSTFSLAARAPNMDIPALHDRDVLLSDTHPEAAVKDKREPEPGPEAKPQSGASLGHIKWEMFSKK
jgi:hypothetical protein